MGLLIKEWMSPLAFTINNLLEDFVLPILISLWSVGLEVLVPKGVALLLEYTEGLIELQAMATDGAFWTHYVQRPAGKKKNHHHDRGKWPWSVRGGSAAFYRAHVIHLGVSQRFLAPSYYNQKNIRSKSGLRRVYGYQELRPLRNKDLDYTTT